MSHYSENDEENPDDDNYQNSVATGNTIDSSRNRYTTQKSGLLAPKSPAVYSNDDEFQKADAPVQTK